MRSWECRKGRGNGNGYGGLGPRDSHGEGYNTLYVRVQGICNPMIAGTKNEVRTILGDLEGLVMTGFSLHLTSKWSNYRYPCPIPS